MARKKAGAKKKVAKKKATPKKRATKRKPIVRRKITPKESNTERLLIENFVSLQKIMTNLTHKFENLNNEISELLGLFKTSAKTLAEKDFDFGTNKENEAKVLSKLDNLAEQNKIIAKGLTLLHERELETEKEIKETAKRTEPTIQKPIPPKNIETKSEEEKIEPPKQTEYQESIAGESETKRVPNIP